MQMDLKTVNIEPKRRSYAHVAARIGAEKLASRYQEGTFDMQVEGPQHYRPLWDPAHDYFDPDRTRIRMQDWYAFKDPRQYYYGSYVIARSRQQETAESAFAFVESRSLADAMPTELRETALKLLLPLRHVAWGSSMNNETTAAYGYGAAITQGALYYAMDQLGIAQFLTRIGLLLDQPEALETAREAWLHDEAWQPLRRLVEDLFVEKDWFEVLVAQDLVLDGLLYPLIYGAIVDNVLAMQGGSAVAMVCQFQSEWHAEASKWIDAQVKAAIKDTGANGDLIAGWVRKWRARAVSALLPVAAIALGDGAEEQMDEVLADFDKRLAKLGVSA
ncbi:phenol hydroxylase [Novosphingobium profundi]|uniref:aromatic/alkene monooxygenase hydroxylase subunit beta n=1 Tax=Novosphingobium profundi TaxID=1774954 RepID=UPI001BD98906|nr:aromatic/alkene monooxygenase hydroxylase subunit beta [Novosphingobium profundi]MBT0670121.1 phenol hydroxylase [Novosphingobium profundi]